MRTSFSSAHSPFTRFSKQRRKGGQQVPRALCPTHLSRSKCSSPVPPNAPISRQRSCCDIKPQNILLGRNDAVLKIADLGLAKPMKRDDDDGGSASELRGTPSYMSPEMVAGGDQGPPADVWAAGCVVVELLTGAPAWPCSDVAGLLMRIGGGGEVPAIPSELSEGGKDFLGKIFVSDPKERWTAEMLLNHPFVCDLEFGDDVKVTAYTSPRGPLDWVSSPQYSPEYGCSFPGELPPAERLLRLVADRTTNLSVSDDWVTVR